MLKQLTLAAVMASMLSGCAVYMAATGYEEPNLSNVHRGASRGEVEMVLGQPKSFLTLDDGGEQAVYSYVQGNEPAPGRALGHAVLDGLTFGVWEVVGTPIEAFNQGDKVEVDVTYDNTGTVTNVHSSK